MIWYLLYPLRGTTEPPRLSASHPIRRAFQAHGTATARHWLLSILVTITVSVLLCYQAIFQFDSTAAVELRNIPKHVWTSMTQITVDRPADFNTDVVMRQVWVHGDWMNAINPATLRDALAIQEALIRTGFDKSDDKVNRPLLNHDRQGCIAAPLEQNWGWHSPLMYWNCSLSVLLKDKHSQDLLATINARTKTYSAIKLTLRPSTVFAGKTFSGTKLRAADVLVITLFDMTNGTLDDDWDVRSRQIAKDFSADWDVFPETGKVIANLLYEFRFREMTLVDDLLLASSYIVTAAYVIWKMMQLRAVKSWFGLLITICAKMSVCIIASFTLCTYLNINLARIPRPWFPGVVFCFGLGNIFRLINVVLETPPEMPPHQRVGNALGEVGHLSLAIAFQNLALIYICSRLVTPWVADFCVFAAVTLVFDLVFHLTFFVAVLSVDVQRLELSDSLERIDFSQAAKKTRKDRQSWLTAVREGNLPLSTRFAGTVAIFSMIIAVNWHFFEVTEEPISLKTITKKLAFWRTKTPKDPTWSPPPILQARDPADWLRIQDHNTARELFAFIKPDSQNFVARVYEPLLFVAKGAIGRDRSQSSSSLLEALRRFTQAHAFPAALMVVSLIAIVTLLMNYLLWTGLPETSSAEVDGENIFTVKTLPTPQTLDVVRLVSGSKGHLSAISLDRSTVIWLHSPRGYLHTTLRTATMIPKLWPIYASAMDQTGSLLGLCSDTGQIGLWSVTASRFLMLAKIDLQGQMPMLFSFATLTTQTDAEKLCLILVSQNGYLTELEARTGMHHTQRISSSPIICASLFASKKSDSSLVFVTKPGEVHIRSLKEYGTWISEVVASLDPGPPSGKNPSKIKCVRGEPSLGLLFALRDEVAEIIHFSSRALIHTFQIGHVKPHSFRVMHPVRRVCSCGAPSVHSLSIVYAEQGKDHMIMQTFTLDETFTSQICLGKPHDRKKYNCRGLDSTKDTVQCVEPAGAWETTNALNVIGIRKCPQPHTPSSTASDDGHFTADPYALESALKKRAQKQTVPNSLFRTLTNRSQSSRSDTDWEAWTLSSTGEFRSRPLLPDDLDQVEPSFEDGLFVAAPGPIAKLGKRSVAIGFGNTVKIITIGKESFDVITTGDYEPLDGSLGSYKSRVRTRGGKKLQ